MANEKQLIDANALNRALIEEYHGMLSDETLKIYQVIRILDECPTVDAVEVVHGRWIEKMDMVASYLAGCEETFCECSVCNSPNYGETLYCPNCGAKMDL